MDLNYFLSRHQRSLFAAQSAACASSRHAHRGLADGYARQIRAFQENAGAGAVLAAAA